MNHTSLFLALVALLLPSKTFAGSVAVKATHGMVVSQTESASEVGVQALKDGGNAVDAAIATAFALAVTHPTAGNIGGGGFLIYRPASGEPTAFDFRETAPAAATADMWLVDGEYDSHRHHLSHLAVGVPGSVAGLHLAWKDHGSLPWERLVEPAIRMAEEGITVTQGLSESLERVFPRLKPYPASIAKFSIDGKPLQTGQLWKQPELAATLRRIAAQGPAGFYQGETAQQIVAEMKAGNGLITLQDLASYQAKRRYPIIGNYRGHEIVSMPPPSSGGTILVEILNVLEGYDLRQAGFGSAKNIHRYAEAMRRAYADRALHLGDPDFNSEMPIERLTSKEYANDLRESINEDRATKSSPDRFDWPAESTETTHLSVVDADRNAVSLTTTLEHGYGSGIVVPGGGFLLNNEMGDFNAAPGLTTEGGLIGTPPNITAPGKRMLSSMTPTIVSKDGQLLMVTGTRGGRTIINCVMQTIVNVIDFDMNAQEAVDAGRLHHQWLPDRILYERRAFSPDTIQLLRDKGHTLIETSTFAAPQVIVVREGKLQGGSDRRDADGAAVGY